MEYVIQGKLDNTVHEISYNQIYKMFKENEIEETEGNLITLSSYREENYCDGINDRVAFPKEYLLRGPKQLVIKHIIHMVCNRAINAA